MKEEEGGAEEGAESEATRAKDGETVPAADAEGDGGESTKKKTADSGKKKDVEMKDAESSEPGSLAEPGAHQAVSVLGIALIAMGEEIGAEMALRTFNHLVMVTDRGKIFKRFFHLF